MPTLDELRQQLQETKEAISAIKRGGQEVQTRNGRYKMADLSVLREEQAELERQIAEVETASASPCGAGFGTPVAFFGKRF